MTREHIFRLIDQEREYQKRRWGCQYDDSKWGANDWVAFITKYSARALDTTADGSIVFDDFSPAMIKVAALAVAALEAVSA